MKKAAVLISVAAALALASPPAFFASGQSAPGPSPGQDTTAGCYDIEVHQCACTTTEAACLAGNDPNNSNATYYWTDACNCNADGSSAGCYIMGTHKCDCTAQSTKEECEANGNNIWTGACGWGYGQPCGPSPPPGEDGGGCFVLPGNGAGTAGCNCDANVTVSDCFDLGGVWAATCAFDGNGECSTFGTAGCYSGGPEHTCDCNIDEESCATADNAFGKVGIWTEQCGCGGAGDTDPNGGCYELSNHQCNCDSSRDACEAQNPDGADPQYFWTGACSCDGTPSAGCFLRDTFECLCSETALVFDDCFAQNGVWTDMCAWNGDGGCAIPSTFAVEGA